MVYEFYITPEEYEIAKSNGIQKKTLEMRVWNLAWDKQRAITEKVKPHKSLKHWIELAESNGICEGTFLTRIRKLKWSEEKAATTKVIDNTELLLRLAEKGRKYPKEIIELAKSNGIPYNTFQSRVVRQKMDFLSAATIPLRTRSEVSAMGRVAYKKYHRHSFNCFVNKKMYKKVTQVPTKATEVTL
ncbi:hypothetical protein NNC19_07370 [Clostridium sp. SHJSY1]|uniref:hypothetical protein n=1 Tax=Clostridium sp. SHJSY1 TaxID=2942483 RepID=UPI002876DA40|nr:hypothetical protein [Clostridium sp. SHJSY1]MDS0525494.1 hypothetical protein [Clostridium sp. SHJSY1]